MIFLIDEDPHFQSLPTNASNKCSHLTSNLHDESEDMSDSADEDYQPSESDSDSAPRPSLNNILK